MLRFAAASLIYCCISRPAVLFLFYSAHDLRAKLQSARSRAALRRSVSVSCSECPSRCYTELPPCLAGRRCSHCNQAVRVSVCYQTAWLGGCVSSPNSCSPAASSQLPANIPQYESGMPTPPKKWAQRSRSFRRY